MPNRPLENHPIKREVSKPEKYQSVPSQIPQHGALSILLDVPTESLTHITSFLDPPSLLILSRVCKQLHNHVEDDNTWHRAFVYQYFGISPESDVYYLNCLLLRRSESTWKSEFIVRYKLTKQWEWSRNGTVTHLPFNSPVSSIHLMSSHVLLTSYLQPGLVSRSLSLTGKIFRGFIYPSGVIAGNGNPNPDFTASVSTCVLSSDGRTARILWGFENGEVAVLTINKVTERGEKAGVKLARCKFEDQHDGAITDSVWGKVNGVTLAVTGGADGMIKLWDSKRVTCLWAPDESDNPSVPDPCVKVVFEKGTIVGAMQSGNIVVWTGFASLLSSEDILTPTINAFRISSPLHEEDFHPFAALYIDHTPSAVTLLVSYENHPYFYRLQVDESTRAIEVTRLGDICAPITAILPCFAHAGGGASFVITGDQLGYVSLYDWHGASGSSPIRKFEANADGSTVTALAWNGVVLVVGSARSMVGVWHALTFERLREFSVSRRSVGGEDGGGVQHILLGPERETLIVAAGNRIMAWRAGSLALERGGAKRKNGGMKKKRAVAAEKYHHLQELQDTISQSRLELEEEHSRALRAYGQEKEQKAQLENLGLSEVEAVEYVLMVSRDEAEMERRRAEGSQDRDEGILQGHLDEPTASTIPLSQSAYASMTSMKKRAVSSTPLSASNEKVQVSRRASPEAMEASSVAWGKVSPPVRTDDIDHFPPMGAGLRLRSGLPPGSVESVKSVWGKDSPGRVSARVPNVDGPSSAKARKAEGEMDEGLRLAIDMSLLEAKRSGKVV